MKIGVLADIHGDIDALEEALYLLERQPIDVIVCAGDIVGKGPYPLPVVERLEQLNVPCIAGNHERYWTEAHAANDPVLPYIQRLPPAIRFEWESTYVILAHGAPWSDMVFVYPNTERHVFKRISAEAKADIVLLGHTHAPLLAKIGTTRICNPGSVCGTHTSGSRTFGILTLPQFSFEVFAIASGKPIDIPQIHMIR